MAAHDPPGFRCAYRRVTSMGVVDHKFERSNLLKPSFQNITVVEKRFKTEPYCFAGSMRHSDLTVQFVVAAMYREHPTLPLARPPKLD